jgi:hypothetical protein
MKFSALSAAFAASVLVAPAHAAIVLDQDNFITIVTPGNQAVQGIGRLNDRRQAQSVLAGVTGTLTRIDLQVASIGNVGTNNLAIEIIRGGVSFLPAGPGPSPLLVAGSSLPNFQVVDQNNFLSLDVSSLNFQTVAGQDFLIYVYAQTPVVNARFALLFGEDGGLDVDGNQLYASTRDYAPGVNYITDNTGNLPWQATIYDRGFRTYVNAAAVPEPASWALMIAGFGLVGGMMRRRAAQVVFAKG